MTQQEDVIGVGEQATPASTPAPGDAGGVEYAVRTSGLSKRFRGGQYAVRDLDLEVPAGSVFGFLGPNGSGKTTTIRMLLGLAMPTTGAISVLGHEMPRAAAAVLPRVGALIEGPAGYPHLPGRDVLARLDAADPTASRRTRRERIETALERVGLSTVGNKRYRAYSLGMRQRLTLAGALLRPRDLLVLDEPTNGLDPQGTREIRSLIRSLAGEGATIMLSSHLLAEIEQVCTHAAVLSHGRLLTQGPVGDLTARGRARLVVVTPDAATAAETVRGLGLADPVVTGERLDVDPGETPAEDVNAALVGAGVRVRELRTVRPTLEESFVELTGEGFDVRE